MSEIKVVMLLLLVFVVGLVNTKRLPVKKVQFWENVEKSSGFKCSVPQPRAFRVKELFPKKFDHSSYSVSIFLFLLVLDARQW